MSPATPQPDRYEAIYELLVESYGEPEWYRRQPPVAQLVNTILSQQTTSANRQQAFDRLRERFPTWEAVMDAPLADVRAAIRPAGLSNQKAPRIQNALRYVWRERGELNLEFLADLPVAEAKAWLTEIKGVGPKTEKQLNALGIYTLQQVSNMTDKEYEIIGETRSDGEGRVDATVSVPSWAEAGDRFVFVVETPDHETKVLSEPFPVTASGRTSPDPGSDDPAVEVVEVTGRLTDEGVECQALRSDGGRLYTLLGDLDGFQTGDRVRVEGQRAEMSFCMQGTTLTVVRIEGARGA